MLAFCLVCGYCDAFGLWWIWVGCLWYLLGFAVLVLIISCTLCGLVMQLQLVVRFRSVVVLRLRCLGC